MEGRSPAHRLPPVRCLARNRIQHSSPSCPPNRTVATVPRREGRPPQPQMAPIHIPQSRSRPPSLLEHHPSHRPPLFPKRLQPLRLLQTQRQVPTPLTLQGANKRLLSLSIHRWMYITYFREWVQTEKQLRKWR